MKNYEFKDTAPLPMSNDFVDTGHEPEKEFQPEYFSGLPHDVERAKKFIGHTVQVSDDGIDWYIRVLMAIDRNDPINSYGVKSSEELKKHEPDWFTFMRTCPDTFESQTRYIKFGPGQIPAPETEEPKNGALYYYACSDVEDGYWFDRWQNDRQIHTLRFKNGIYLKEEHAKEAVDVIRGIMGRDE
jgi:hypothetical protein